MFASSDDSVPITNFGGNIRFVPRYRYAPTTEAEVLDLLDRHAGGRVRVVGALHSWSPAVVTEDALIDLRHFNRVAIEQGPEGKVWVTAGGGCRIKHLLRELHAQSGATLPTMGLVTEQTIAGAISTGTHGSGRPSLSHYMDEIRVAAYDADTGKARIYVWNEGAELRAARCALGRMGVVLSVRFRAVPKYDVAETITPSATLDEVWPWKTSSRCSNSSSSRTGIATWCSAVGPSRPLRPRAEAGRHGCTVRTGFWAWTSASTWWSSSWRRSWAARP